MQSTSHHRTPPSSRRGVLLLVVLSLLVLFMLIGTAFLMSSNQYRNASTASAKLNRLGNDPTKLLDGALMKVLRDTGEPDSAIRYHSLLRDLYGSDGFEAVIYSPFDDDVDLAFPATSLKSQFTRYASPTYGTVPSPPFGPTQGQLIDVYVRELAFKAVDPLIDTTPAPPAPSLPDARHVLKLEPGVNGVFEMYNMPLTKGYFNGALLTITAGPAAGQTTRIVDYEYLGDMAPALSPPVNPALTAPFPAKIQTRLFRFRVMAFPRADGLPLTVVPSGTRRGEISDLVGATFIVNGRPFNGTGAGFNELAVAGGPRLTAREGIKLGTTPAMNLPSAGTDLPSVLYPEIALTPNSVYFFNFDPVPSTAASTDLAGARYPIPVRDLTTGQIIRYSGFEPLNPKSIAVANRVLQCKYQTFVGPGDADESYDAPDFQNIALAMQTVTPRARGRYVQDNSGTALTLDVDDPTINPSQFLRLDLEDLPLPSYFRPDLENYWFHLLAKYAADPTGSASLPTFNDNHVLAVLQPYGVNGIRNDGDDPTGVALEVRDQIVALKRKISLRPIREDHPNFDGGNPASRPVDLSSVSPLQLNGNIAVPYWEAVGPWDVDNDNDGVPDSIWVDLGDPIAQAEDGTLYKPLYAFLIVDLDSRLNVNAHGLADDLRSPDFSFVNNPAYTGPSGPEPPMIPGPNLANFGFSNFLPQGLGYGPAEISLRPIFSPNIPGNLDPALAARLGNPAYDDYARILVGRPALGDQPSVWGRHGSVNVRGNAGTTWTDNVDAAIQAYKVRPGIPYQGGPPPVPLDSTTVDSLALFKFFGHPWWLSNYYGVFPTPSAFATPPDLMGRYALGLDYAGQPVIEPKADAFGYGEHSLLFDTPYELNLSDPNRRDEPAPSVAAGIVSDPAAAVNDDAPFATADLERILRAHDADAGVLPDRLWNLVDAFDPLKLSNVHDGNATHGNQPDLVQKQAAAMFGAGTIGDPELLAAAQQLAGVNRRLVTTDSYDLPVPGASLLSRLVFGADGQPGRAGVDDNGDSVIDDLNELGWGDSDDWYPIMNGIRTSTAAPTNVRLVPEHPTLVDLLEYRIQLARWQQGAPIFVDTPTDTPLSDAVQYLLPPEVIAGKRMDLNRPFGDGVDNGDGIDNDTDGTIDEPGEPGDQLLNGIVDEPEEAGEPFIDRDPDGPGPLTANGRRDPGEYFYNIINGNGALTNNDAEYNGPIDRLWTGLTSEPIGFDYNHGGDVTDGRKIDLNGDGDVYDPGEGILRNNGIIQRQTYARQLYCLMMLLVDENYVASQDFFPDVAGAYDLSFLDEKGNFDLFILHQQLALDMALRKLQMDGVLTPANGLSPAFQTQLGAAVNAAKPYAYAALLRKLTARRVAQWAINCVDFHDADSVMTPFEYDENPWDGWGVYFDPALPFSSTNFIPLDGDVSTNENWGRGVPLPKMPGDVPAPPKFDPYRAIVNNPASPDYNPRDDVPLAEYVAPFRPSMATRDVVWGAERPELLITETLALHDRRSTDESDPSGLPPHNQIGTPPSSPSLSNPPDYDLDQKLKPRGSLFVELYNPWSADVHEPAEFYGTTPLSGGQQGVLLNRLSTLADGVSGKKSPVWRMTVLNEPFAGKISNQVVDPRNAPGPAFPSPVEQAARQILSTDPDGYGIDMDRDAERFIYFTTGGDTDRLNDRDFTYSLIGGVGDYEYTPGNVPKAMVNQLGIRVPPLPIRWATPPSSGTPSELPFPAARRYFIARTERDETGPIDNDFDVQIAPILPGRYAVVGSSGLQLAGSVNEISGTNTPGAMDGDFTTRFVTPISRLIATETNADPNYSQRENLYKTRRIELWPSADPTKQQLLVGENGGPEFVRTNAGMVNVTDSTSPGAPGNGIPDPGNPNNENPSPNNRRPELNMIDPCVAIPVEDMSVSEPVEGYPSLLYRKLFVQNFSQPPLPLEPAPVNVTPDGELEYSNSYDRPLDLEFELTRNGTTQNYRTLHLQRLANPSLPWNPPPFDRNGNPNELHQPGLPVNPYLTVDSQSVDLTAYNGASQLERTALPVIPNPPEKPLVVAEDELQGNFLGPITPEEVAFAPDHVLWAFIFMLKQELLDVNGNLQPPIVPKNDWITPQQIREEALNSVEKQDNEFENKYLHQFFLNKQVTENNEDLQRRDALIAKRMDSLGRKWDGTWGWSLFRRILPDDEASGTKGGTGAFAQWLHLKSLERGSHDTAYYSNRVPYTAFYKDYDMAGVLNQAPGGWAYDPSWEPRLLWRQTRPNARLFLRSSTAPDGIVEASDLNNAQSRRVLQGRTPLPDLTPEEDLMTIPEDVLRHNTLAWDQLRSSSNAIVNGEPEYKNEQIVDYMLEQTLGFANQSYAPELDRTSGNETNAILSVQRPGAPEVAMPGSPAAPALTVADANATLVPDMTPYDIPKEILNSPRKGSLIQSLSDIISNGPPALAALATTDRDNLIRQFYERRNRLMKSTYPWLAWNDRPFVSADEIMQVPASSSSQLLHDYSVFNLTTPNPYDGSIKDDGDFVIESVGSPTFTDLDGTRNTAYRYNRQRGAFGHLLNFFQTSAFPATATVNNVAAELTGAPNYSRLLDYVEVPSRYVGTETMLSPEIFNDNPLVNTPADDVVDATDPRYALQPPFNTVSRQRDPGRVNLNTVTGRRTVDTDGVPQVWSEVYDGIMHRSKILDPNSSPANPTYIAGDGNLTDASGNVLQFGHLGPAWRDVALSRRGYAQFNADPAFTSVDKRTLPGPPDTFAFGLNKEFPSIFSNPFRSASAGDLVPLDQLQQYGVDASWLRAHPRTRGVDGGWGLSNVPGEDDNVDLLVNDQREAGFGDDPVSVRREGSIPEKRFFDNIPGVDDDGDGQVDELDERYHRELLPLFCDSAAAPAIDALRNPAMLYQPMTRLGNLVTTRSNVYAIWVTVGYFEVERSPDWNANENNVQQRFGGDGTATAANPTPNDASVRARALYDRVYPEGYMLGQEVGAETGNTKRQRAFYIIDRTEPVGFKPGEDLNVENMIRVRRRIE
jgi:hypothetical protein